MSELRQYRKKPVVIEAIQWDGTMEGTCWIKEIFGGNILAYEKESMPPIPILKVVTLEGEMHASKGDYIIKGVKGEIYPCKPDIFEATYEKAELQGEKNV